MRLAATLCLAACWLATVGPSPALGVEGSTAPVGDVRLPSGHSARHAYHHDRNALLDARPAGDALVALTHSGALLRFDARSLGLAGEWFGPVAATCLGAGEGGALLVGFADGRIGRVEPLSFAMAEVARVAGAVRWVGWSPGGLVAVAEVSKHSVVHDLASGRTWKLTQTRRDPKTGKETAFDRRGSAFLLDGKRRLWVGADRGEWGGWCARVDLAPGTVAEVEGIMDSLDDLRPGWDGVRGFVERPDGQVWAFGGVLHGILSRGSIRRVDGPKAETLHETAAADPNRGGEGIEAAPGLGPPRRPIDLILPDRDGKLLVLSHGRRYRVDPGLKEWSKGRALQANDRPGLPPEADWYPWVVAAHRLGDRLVLASAVDGLVEVIGDRDVFRTLPGQMGLDSVHRIAPSAEGTLFFPKSFEVPPWRLGPGGWEEEPAPPFTPAPGGPRVEDEGPSWGYTSVMVGPGGTTYAAGGRSFLGPAARTTARWVDGRWEILGREKSNLNVAACFVTPDGTLWNAWSGKLWRFVGGAWREVATLPGADPAGPRVEPSGETGLKVGHGLRAVGIAGPPWLLVDPDESQLLRLTHGPEFKSPRLDAVKVADGAVPLKVLDALAWSKGEVLLATDRGLRRFDASADRVGPAGLPSPEGPIKSLARDGLGRIWIGGEGLWLVEGGRLVDVGAVPMIGRSAVEAMSADPDHVDGVIVSLGERGVAFVRVAPGR